MYKKILMIVIGSVLSLLMARPVLASVLSVKIESPKTPVNTKDFRIDFVALDLDGRTIDVKCFFRKTGDGFSQFDSLKNLPSGGGNGYCQVTGTQITSAGSYEFYVTAQTSSETVTSATVAVSYDDKQPGTPVYYNKELQLDGCSYKISFKTANDGGQTSKVELYRSADFEFTADSSTKVAEIGIGSDQENIFFNGKPDCSKNYYYVIRAFNSVGNGSDLIGDGIIVGDSVNNTIAGSQQVAQAVAVDENDSQVRGNPSTNSGLSENENGEVLGEDAGDTDMDTEKGIFSIKNILIGFAVVILAGLIAFKLKRKK